MSLLPRSDSAAVGLPAPLSSPAARGLSSRPINEMLINVTGALLSDPPLPALEDGGDGGGCGQQVEGGKEGEEQAAVESLLQHCRLAIISSQAWEETQAGLLSAEQEETRRCRLQLELQQQQVEHLTLLRAADAALLLQTNAAAATDRSEREATQAEADRLSDELQASHQQFRQRQAKLETAVRKAQQAGEQQCAEQAAGAERQQAALQAELRRSEQQAEEAQTCAQTAIAAVESQLTAALNRLKREAQPRMADELQAVRQQLLCSQQQLAEREHELEKLRRDLQRLEEARRRKSDELYELQEERDRERRAAGREQRQRGDDDRERKGGHRRGGEGGRDRDTDERGGEGGSSGSRGDHSGKKSKKR